MELYVILSWNKMGLYSLLDNIPSNSNILIFNLKWMNSDINSAILNSENINVVDVELEEDFIETLNTVLINGNIQSEKVVLIKPEKIPVYTLLSASLRRITQRQIYEGYGYYVFWYDKEIIQNVSFKDSNVNNTFSEFINQLEVTLDYDKTPKTENISIKKKDTETMNNKKYKIIVYSRCQERLFNEIKESDVCDTLYSINFGRNNLSIKLLNTIQKFDMDEYFIIVNHYSSSLSKCLKKIRTIDVESPITVSDNKNNEIYIINKRHILKLNMNNYYTDVEILKLLKANSNNQINVIDDVEEVKKIDNFEEVRKPKKSEKKDNYFIFVLPFMNNGDRLRLFEESIKNLKYQIDKSSINAEILVHECGDKKTLSNEFIGTYIDQYMFNKYTDVFHRAWCFNVATRYCKLPAKKDNLYFVFMDSDILVNSNWIHDLQYIDEKILIGWNELYDLTYECTNDLYSSNTPVNFSDLLYIQKRHPSIFGACGGITIINKDVFFEIKGFPEYFKGSWGGEDNAFMNKAIAFGYTPKTYDNCIYHLYHNHKTIRDDSVRKKWREDIIKWDNKKWIIETQNIKENWGIGKKITISMINYLREDKLIRTLKNIYDSSRMPLNVIIQIQDRNNISDDIRDGILNELNKFKSYQIIWNDDNLGTAIPRYNTTQESLKNCSDYTFIIDSDMLLNDGTLELLYNKIEDEPEYGAISCWCKPYYAKWKIQNNKLKQERLTEGFHDSDTLGTGCVIIRTDIFDKAHFNKDLIIGYIDFIWCMEVKNNTGYKLGILCDPNHKILNDAKGNSKEYTKARQNKEAIEMSKKFIKEKYNIIV